MAQSFGPIPFTWKILHILIRKYYIYKCKYVFSLCFLILSSLWKANVPAIFGYIGWIINYAIQFFRLFMAIEFVYPFAMELHSQGFSDRNAWHLRFNETFQLLNFWKTGKFTFVLECVLGCWIWNLDVPCSNPPSYHYLDLFAVVPSSTPQLCCVNNQLVSFDPFSKQVLVAKRDFLACSLYCKTNLFPKLVLKWKENTNSGITYDRCCLQCRFSHLIGFIPCYKVTFHWYFWCSQFSEFLINFVMIYFTFSKGIIKLRRVPFKSIPILHIIPLDCAHPTARKTTIQLQIITTCLWFLVRSLWERSPPLLSPWQVDQRLEVSMRTCKRFV